MNTPIGFELLLECQNLFLNFIEILQTIKIKKKIIMRKKEI